MYFIIVFRFYVFRIYRKAKNKPVLLVDLELLALLSVPVTLVPLWLPALPEFQHVLLDPVTKQNNIYSQYFAFLHDMSCVSSAAGQHDVKGYEVVLMGRKKFYIVIYQHLLYTCRISASISVLNYLDSPWGHSDDRYENNKQQETLNFYCVFCFNSLLSDKYYNVFGAVS